MIIKAVSRQLSGGNQLRVDFLITVRNVTRDSYLT